MSREPVEGRPFASVAWQSTAALWGSGTERPAALQTAGYGLVRVLSEDPATGARTMLIKEPPGWHTAACEAHSVLQEDILELVLHNCRMPQWNRSDFYAIVAAIRTAGPAGSASASVASDLAAARICGATRSRS